MDSDDALGREFNFDGWKTRARATGHGEGRWKERLRRLGWKKKMPSTEQSGTTQLFKLRETEMSPAKSVNQC